MEGDFRLGEWLVCPQLNTVQAMAVRFGWNPSSCRCWCAWRAGPARSFPKKN